MSDLRTYTTASLGIRNNNPGNLRTGENWKGEIGSNKGFAVFSSVEYGIRAMAKDLTHKINSGLNTINKYITKYAPPSENDTTAYINNVSNATGIGSNIPLQANPDTLAKLIRAQINVENGVSGNLITNKMISDGIALANNGIPPVAGVGIGLFVAVGAILAFVYFNKSSL